MWITVRKHCEISKIRSSWWLSCGKNSRAREYSSPTVASRKTNNKAVVQSHTANTFKRPVCQQDHALSSCDEFKSKAITQRHELVNKFRRCCNCLSGKHTRKDCLSKNSCRICQKQHHTLLHEETKTSPSETSASMASEAKSAESSQITSHLLSKTNFVKTGIFLATACIRVSSPDGRYSTLRVMLDQGSAMTLVTERLIQRLRIKKHSVSVAISGIGGASVAAQHAVHVNVAARDGRGGSYPTSALVLKSLTSYTPPRANDFRSLDHLHGLALADQSPTSSDAVDILIGAYTALYYWAAFAVVL